MKRVILRSTALLFTLLLVFTTTGCEQLLAELPFLQNTVEKTQPAAIPEVTPSMEPVETEAPSLMEEELTNITIWLPPAFDPENGSPEGQLLRRQLQAFSTENPEITVNIRIKALSGPGGLLDSLSAASLAAPAVLPGLLILPRADLEAAASSGLISPVEVENNPAFQVEQFAFAEDMAVFNDTRYGLPFAADALCLAYKSQQVVYPPKTWQEVIQLNKVLAFPAAEQQGSMALLLYLDKGGSFTQNEIEVTVNEEALQQTLLFLAEGANSDVLPYWLTDYTTYDESWQAVRDARASYAVILASQYLAEMTENTAITSLPSFDEEPLTLADGWVIAFPQTSPERLTVYQQLAAYLVEPEFQAAWTEAAGKLPVSSSALAAWKNSEVSGILLEIAQSARLAPSAQIVNKVGPLFTQATIEMLKKQTTYIESSNKIIKALAE